MSELRPISRRRIAWGLARNNFQGSLIGYARQRQWLDAAISVYSGCKFTLMAITGRYAQPDRIQELGYRRAYARLTAQLDADERNEA